jgi:hypothetical protein
MKKTIVLSFALVVFGAIAANAQNATPAAVTQTTEKTEAKPSDRTPVKQDALPEPVKKTLASEEYKGWEVGEIFWVTGDKGAYYEIHLKQVEKTIMVNIDKEGKKVS